MEKLINISIVILFIIAFCFKNMEALGQSKIDYLGQKTPGMVGELFAPGLISTNGFEHSAPAFSPDGSVVLWTLVDRSFRASMYEMRFENGKWSKPYRPTFADSTADDYYPSFSPDGKKLYFGSRRKVPKGYPQGEDMRIWEVERTKNGWGIPIPYDTLVSTGIEFAHSIARSGTMYFSASTGGGTNFNICRSEKGKKYKSVAVLPFDINSVDYEDGPYISPDESFLIFESHRPGAMVGGIDLYISFRGQNNSWSSPVNMGPAINSDQAERFARLSPDGKYLFFGSNRNQSSENWGFDIFWVDAKVIDEIRKNVKVEWIKSPLGDELITSLYNNDGLGAIPKLQEWLHQHPTSLDATILLSSNLRNQNRFTEADVVIRNAEIDWSGNISITLEKALINFGMNRSDEAIATLEEILKDGPQKRDRLIYLSNALLDMRKFAESDNYFEQALKLQSNVFTYLRRARKFAANGELDRAFETLDKSLSKGLISKNQIENDTELDALKKDDRWNALLGKLK